MLNEQKIHPGKDPSKEPKKENHLNLQEVIGRSEKVRQAYDLAKEAHKDHMRYSGEPYLNHLEEVANIVLDWIGPQNVDGATENITCASLLHDSVEDVNVSIEEIKQKFGEKTASIVEGVTALRSEKPKEEQDRENLRFIAQKGHLTPEVFIVKLADRLHNMRTINSVPDEDKRIKKADETLRVYTKLARSMGMWEVKKELEDLSFPHVYPEIYNRVKKVIDKDPRTSSAFTHGMESYLKWILSENCIDCRVEARINGYWTLYNKMESAASTGKGSYNDFSNINDAVSMRVITSDTDTNNLYTLLGRIHTFSQFKGLVDQERFDDFINQPRDNGYSALQTTLNIPRYGAVEIAFMTGEMEEFNRYGIISSMKKGEDLDRYKRNIVFDERNEAWFLPLDATYVDYVYMTGIGAQARSVMVDGKKVSLTQKTQNAVSVDVQRHDDQKRAPDPELLKHSLNPTRKLIENETNLHAHDILVDKGKDDLEDAIASIGLLDLADSPNTAQAIIFSLGLRDLNELYYLVGGDHITPDEILRKLNSADITKKSLGLTTVRVSGSNQPGVLQYISNLLSDKGGDIYQIHQPNPITQPKDVYSLRVVAKGLSEKTENEIRKLLSEDKRFEEALVV